MLSVRRKSRPFATLGEGIKHKISGIWWTFATLEADPVRNPHQKCGISLKNLRIHS